MNAFSRIGHFSPCSCVHEIPPFTVRATSLESSPLPKKQKAGKSNLPLRKSAAAEPAKLFEFLRHDGELQLGLDERLYHQDLGQFGSGVLGGGHFADEQVLGALEHFLFTEGERLATTEGNEALQHGGHFNERPRAHAFGVLLEAVLPVRMRVEFALFKEAQDFDGFI